MAIPDLVRRVPLDGILRIDVGLEGEWSGTVTTIWSPGKPVDVGNVTRFHRVHKPSLELYFEGAWVGLHCFDRADGLNVFDEELAREIVSFIEASISPKN
jgi:hypothetical protein